MSSPRGIPSADAVLESSQTPSPVLLPEDAPELFVDEFNRIYGKLGWTLTLVKDGQT